MMIKADKLALIRRMGSKDPVISAAAKHEFARTIQPDIDRAVDDHWASIRAARRKKLNIRP